MNAYRLIEIAFPTDQFFFLLDLCLDVCRSITESIRLIS
jgi:hypothetical protein